MNGEEFYGHFKDAISALGMTWREKSELTITFKDGAFEMTRDGRKIITVKDGFEK